jgi:predicted tellurium resistance membrane protein TerC
MEWLTNPEIWVAFFTLTALEIVLGIDNIIMISILVSRMPKHMQARTRIFGLALAMVTRILLAAVDHLGHAPDRRPVRGVRPRHFRARPDPVLRWPVPAVEKLARDVPRPGRRRRNPDEPKGAGGKFFYTIIQIAIIDIVFSLDSVITAVGMVPRAGDDRGDRRRRAGDDGGAGTISDFIDKHPSLKMLALSFLMVVGTVLIAESFDVHVPKGYVYFAMAFSLAVEAINIKMRTAIAKRETAGPGETAQGHSGSITRRRRCSGGASPPFSFAAQTVCFNPHFSYAMLAHSPFANYSLSTRRRTARGNSHWLLWGPPHGGPSMLTLLNLLSAVALLDLGHAHRPYRHPAGLRFNLRHVIGQNMSKRWLAFIAGILVTAMVQSSNATAMLVTSFVGQGLMG